MYFSRTLQQRVSVWAGNAACLAPLAWCGSVGTNLTRDEVTANKSGSSGMLQLGSTAPAQGNYSLKSAGFEFVPVSPCFMLCLH